MAKRIVKRKKSAPKGRKARSAKSKAKPICKVAKTKSAKKSAKAKPVKKAAKKPARSKPVKKPARAKIAVKAKPVKKPVQANTVQKPAAPKAARPRIEARHDLGKAMRIAGLGGRYDAQTMKEIPALWRRLGSELLGKVGARTDEKVYYGICANMDGRGGLDYYAGVEVASFDG